MRQFSPAVSFDWSGTALGARAHWPHTLRLTVDILLNCPCPMLLVWGEQRVAVFNDAYAELAGEAPHAPGGIVPDRPAPLAASAQAFDDAMRGATLTLAGVPLSFAGGHEQHDCFDLHLTPIADEQGTVAGVLYALARSARRSAAGADNGLRILVVEDNLDSQYLVCEMLKAFGHHADGVADGEGALQMLVGACYDVLFSDVSLPGMSGVELARRALDDHPAIKVIFASGYGEALLRHVDFPYVSLQKPYELEQLQRALADVAAGLRR